HSDLYPTQLSPKGAVVFAPVKNQALHLSVGHAFLTPNLTSLFAATPVGNGVLNLTAIETKLRADPSLGPALATVPAGTLFGNAASAPASACGNPHLAPQTVTNYEVGYKGEFWQRLFITVDAYDAHMQNFTTGLLPAVPIGATPLNPSYQPWTAPSA